MGPPSGAEVPTLEYVTELLVVVKHSHLSVVSKWRLPRGKPSFDQLVTSGNRTDGEDFKEKFMVERELPSLSACTTVNCSFTAPHLQVSHFVSTASARINFNSTFN